jgi:hypothetical protein
LGGRLFVFGLFYERFPCVTYVAQARCQAVDAGRTVIVATGPTMRIGLHGEERGHVTHEERMFARKTRAEA